MCGFTGFFSPHSGFTDRHAIDILHHMADVLIHRGPDSDGYWFDPETGVGLAHRRLAIVDLSPAGAQPMQSVNSRYQIAFNGEIYNHLDLRAQLEKSALAPSWRGHSDTETLLAGFSAWGIKATIERCIGMFAFAVWDQHTRVLTLGRDRLGEKPLYYGWQGTGEQACFLFGSELKALKMHPAFEGSINRDALCLLMRHNYIPAPHSIYSGIYKLQPGSLLMISSSQREPAIETYWSLSDVAISGSHRQFTGSPTQVIDQLEILLKSAVHQQMAADVPLGAFLSGGIDSSTIVALMQAQSERPIQTFTIGFHEADYNEAVHAQAIARHLGTDHTELYVSAQQALDIIPKLPALYCEPLSDSSQIPTFLVSQLARQKVTVSLSGDAGDELFGGYNRYVFARRLWSKIATMPVGLRAIAAHGIQKLSPAVWDKLLGPFQYLAPKTLRQMSIGDKLHKGASVLAARSLDELYLHLVTHWDPVELVLAGKEPETYLQSHLPRLAGLNEIERMMALDTITYLPDDILAKVDRAAMGVSLESRVPFLDHRVVEFAWRIPLSMKIHQGGTSKWILRQILYRHVPKALIERPKMGFGVPIGAWLRGPLRDWAEALLDEGRLRREGYFHPVSIRKKWNEHLSGKRNWQYLLWDILIFQAWLDGQRT